MPNWKFKTLMQDKELGYAITKGSCNRGDVHGGRCAEDRTFGPHWITKGKVNLVGLNGEILDSFGPDERIKLSNPDNYKSKKVIIISLELTKYFCIMDPDREILWNGEIISLEEGEYLTIPDMLDKRVFVSKGSGSFNKALVREMEVAVITEDTLDIHAEVPMTLTTFWRDI